MTLKTSFIVGLAVAALVVGVQTASAAPTSDGSNRTNLAQPDGQSFVYPGGRALSGLGYIGNPNLVQPDFGQSFLYPGGYALSGLGDIGHPPPYRASAVESGSEIDWPQQLGIGFGVGMVILLGLILTVRVGRSHPLAH